MEIKDIYRTNGWLCATIDGLPMALDEKQYPDLFRVVSDYEAAHLEAVRENDEGNPLI